MSSMLFDIKKLSCSYSLKNEDKVLFIESLQIPRGKITFLLGASGSGKSTFLETLGLMNNTIVAGEMTFYPDCDSQPVFFSQLWQKDNQETIAKTRRKHFSFIFQQTNLMENFTAYENICISRMIQNESPQEEVILGAKQLMNSVRLPEDEVDTETRAINLSGGQKQRLAFVRALHTNFTVLFGDEPTGNLDEENARDLMKVIKKQLKATQTAIIVSHDIDIALEYADQLVVITKEPGQRYGRIKSEDIFERTYWENFTSQQLDKFRHKLTAYYASEAISQDVPVERESYNSQMMSMSTYQALFLAKESRALMGKKFNNLGILVTMLVLTLLVVGFANGSIRYLYLKIDDPFVNWLTIDIPYGKTSQTNDIKTFLNTDEEKEKFNYSMVVSYTRYPLYFWDNEREDFLRAQGRSVEVQGQENHFLSDILSDDNWLYGAHQGFQNEQELSLIVTERLLTEFHYSKNATYMAMRVNLYDTILKVPIPIRSVVKEIPGKNLFVFTSCFFNTYNNTFENTFDIRDKSTLRLLLKTDRQNAEKVVKLLQTSVLSQNKYSAYDPDCSVSTHTDSYAQGFDIEISFYPSMTTSQINQLYDDLMNDATLASYHDQLERIYHFDPINDYTTDEFADAFSVYFNKLEHVRAFADTLFYKYNTAGEQEVIEVDIAKVREKENFNFLSSITQIISYLLIAFAAVGVSLFISNLLQMHLTKQKMNLGTLKAFGLGNKQSQSIYFTITVGFTILSLAIAFVLAWSIGAGLDWALSSKLNVEQGVQYFEIIHSTTLVTALILTITTLIVSWITIRRILSKSPGDLIYGR